MEIEYKNIVNIGNNKLRVVFFNNGKELEKLLLYFFERKENNNIVNDYIVIGKINHFEESNNLKIQIKHLESYLEQEHFKKQNIEIDQLRNIYIKFVSNIIKFSQEGYDLLQGKYKYTDGIIQRTIKVDNIESFIGTYSVIDEDNRVDKNNIFLSYDFLLEDYFFNQKEIHTLTKQQLYNYINDNLIKIGFLLNHFPRTLDIKVMSNDLKTEAQYETIVKYINSYHEIQYKKNSQKKIKIN